MFRVNALRRRKTFLAPIGAGIYVANDYFCHLQRDTACRFVYVGARRAVATGELCAFHRFKISILPFRFSQKTTRAKQLVGLSSKLECRMLQRTATDVLNA